MRARGSGQLIGSGFRSLRRVAVDEAEQLRLRVGIRGKGDAGPVLPRAPHDAFNRLHPFEHQSAEPRFNRVDPAAGPREIPGVHEDVDGVEAVNCVGQW